MALTVAGRIRDFEKHHLGLIPAGETFLGVASAAPRGAFAAYGRAAAGVGRRGVAMDLHGEAEQWPTRFARDAKDPDRWRWNAARDFFYVVITDKQLHVFEGRSPWLRGPSRAGPEAAHFPLDRIAAIRFEKILAARAELTITFKDGSRVELDLSNMKIERFLEAIEPFAASA